MNNKYLLTFLIIGNLVLTACSSNPKVFTDYDPEQNFGTYSKFTWTSNNPMNVQSDSPVSPLTERRIMGAISNTMLAKGYQFVENIDQADFTVGFTVGTRDKTQFHSHSAAVYDNWRWGVVYFSPPEVVAKNYTEGTLAIDIFDASRQSPVWHAKASKRLTRADLESPNKGIDEAVEIMLTEFPPE